MKFNQSGYGSTTKETEYWSTHRSKISDLYKSEQHFFTSTILNVQSVLDLGCAAGGSLFFSRELNPNVKYTGIDISEELINIAKKRFEGELSNFEFVHFDGEHIPFKDNSVDFCFSFGVFHHLSDWKKMTHEVLRVSQKFVLFDLRLWPQNSLAGSPLSYQKIALGGEWDGKTVIQYNIQSFNEVLEFLSTLKDQSISAQLYGYYSKPTDYAVTPAGKVLMLAVLLEKNVANPTIKFTIE